MTSISASPAVATVPERRVPPLGGFSLTFLGLEIRRLLRNRRTVVFTLIIPPVFFWAFGTGHTAESAGRGNVTAYVMISLAVYGAMTGIHVMAGHLDFVWGSVMAIFGAVLAWFGQRADARRE